MRLLLLAALALPLTAAAQDQETFYIAPHLNNITEDGVTLIWETIEPLPAVVRYGQAGTLDKSVEATGESKIQRVRISGLEAETEYSYRVETGSLVQESTFKTAPAAQRPITFILIGDSRRWEDRWAETKMEEHAARWNPEFYLTMGDLVVNGHSYDLWPEHFNRFKGITNKLWIVTARGNHEGSQIFDPKNDWFMQYHELPGEGEPYAAFDWGNTHFVLISFESTIASTEWLNEHLASVDNKYTVLAQHFPVYCTGYAGPGDSRKEFGDDAFKPLADTIDKFNVDLDLAGHTHIYERLHAIREGKRDDRNGATYVVNGGDIGANYPDWFTAVADDEETMDKPTYTVFQMEDDRISFRTFCWGKKEEAVIEIDYSIIWKDEEIPKAALAKLSDAQGDELLGVIADLGAMRYEPAAEALLPLLGQTDAAVREKAAQAIRAIGTASVSSALLPYLHDENLTVRRQVARALEVAMDSALAVEVAKAAADPAQDEATRVALLGALQFHAPPAMATETLLGILRAEGESERVRERAVYALSRTAAADDVPVLAELFKQEEQPYVTLRLAFALNKLSGRAQSLDGKAPLARSKPGEERQVFIDKWFSWMKEKAA